MKKHYTFLLLILIFCSVNVLGQSNGWIWGREGMSAGGGGSEGYSTCTDTAGNVFICGVFNSSSITFGSTTFTNAANSNLLYVVKYDSTGNVLWAKSSGTHLAFGLSIWTDVSGNLYLTGWYPDTLTFGTFTLTTVGSNDIFIVKYDPNGNVLWAQSAGGTLDDRAQGVSVDTSGNVFITGFSYSPTITFGSITLTNTGNTNVLTAKYDTNGNPIWARSVGGGNDNEGMSIATDPIGNAFVTGFFISSSLTFGSVTLTNTGAMDMFIVEYDPSGNVLWAKNAGGTGPDEGDFVCVDASKNVYVTGSFYSSSIHFGSTTINNTGNEDVFLAKYDANGNLVWVKDIGGTNAEYSHNVCTDPGGNVYVVGGFLSASLTFASVTLTPPVGSSDPLFIAEYDGNGTVLCASYLSSGGDDWIGASADRFGNVYVGGDFEQTIFHVGPDTLLLQGQEDPFVAKYRSACAPEFVPESGNEENISIYPNPSNGIFTLNSSISNGEIFIYNLMGELVFQSQLNSPAFTIDLSNEASGIYFVHVNTGKELFTRKVIVQ